MLLVLLDRFSKVVRLKVVRMLVEASHVVHLTPLLVFGPLAFPVSALTKDHIVVVRIGLAGARVVDLCAIVWILCCCCVGSTSLLSNGVVDGGDPFFQQAMQLVDLTRANPNRIFHDPLKCRFSTDVERECIVALSYLQ